MSKPLKAASPGEMAHKEELACTHTSLRRAARQLTQLYDDALVPSGLTSAQALLVAQIHQLPAMSGGQAPSLQTLAKRLGIQISALTHALRPLVRDGLVLVAPDPLDRRTKRAVLTAEGGVQLQRMYAIWADTNRRIQQVLGADTTEQLRLLADQVGSPAFRVAYDQTPVPK